MASANLVPMVYFDGGFFIFVYYILIGQYIKPYHLLFSPPFGVLIGISYDPPLTDPF
jgi:hypothetical protein